MSERGKYAAGGTKRTVVDRERHRQLARRVVELVLQDALARVEFSLTMQWETCVIAQAKFAVEFAQLRTLMLSRSFSSAATASSPASCALSGFFASIINSERASFQDENWAGDAVTWQRERSRTLICEATWVCARREEGRQTR